MIQFTCAGCGYSRDVPDEYALRTVTCPKCHEKGLVPDPPSNAAAAANAIEAMQKAGAQPPLGVMDETGKRHDRQRRPQSVVFGFVFLICQFCLWPALVIHFTARPTDFEYRIVELVLIAIYVIGVFVGCIWTAIHCRGRGAETPLWCLLVCLLPFMGLLMYLIAGASEKPK